MKRLSFLFAVVLLGALLISSSVSALVANGNFESGTFGSWTRTAFRNDGLNAAPGGTTADVSTIVGGAAVLPLSLSDANTNNAVKFPAYGRYSARVNDATSYTDGGNPRNANRITQTLDAYIDPLDNRNHVRFAYAAVMVNPVSNPHTDDQKPYFRVRAINTTNSNDVIYDFTSYVNEPGKNWQDGADFGTTADQWKYLDWTVIDLASTDAHPVNSGDDIRIEVTAAGCSLGGHPGYAYVDEITDHEIAGPIVRASGPASALSGGTITYTYSYRNGAADAIDATVTAERPAGVTFTSVSDPACSLAGGNVSCGFTNMPSGATGLFTITGNVTAPNGAEIAHGAYAIAATGFPTVGGQTVLTDVIGNATATSLGIASSANPSRYGQNVTLTATVAPSSGSTKPDGTVQFVVDGSNFGVPVALSGGMASVSTSALTVGNHTVAASYSGAAGFVASSGSLSGGQGVNNSLTATTVGSSPNPSVFGQSVTLSASVASMSPGTGIPAGSVQFVVDGNNFGAPVPLVNGAASLNTSILSVANHTISAEYSGSTGYASSNGSLPGGHTVNAASTATTVSTSPNPSVFGESVSLTATVAAVVPGAGTPAGTVQFSIDGNNFGPPVALSSGTASINTGGMNPGNRAVGAIYSGSNSFTSSTGTKTHNVSRASTSVSISTSVPNSTYGQSVTFTSTVAPVAPGSGAPGGAVSFFDGQTPVPGCQNISLDGSSSATCSFSGLAAGAHTISTSYHGSSTFAGSNGSVGQNVAKANLQITASSHAVTYGALAPGVAPAYSGFVLNESPADLNGAPTCSTNYGPGSPVNGSPYTTGCASGRSNNYIFVYVGGTVTVNKAQLSVVAPSAALTYGDPKPSMFPEFSGFVPGESYYVLPSVPQCSTPYFPGSDASAAPYPVTCSGGTSPNYSFSSSAGQITVAKRELTVTAEDKTRTYGSVNPTLTATFAGFALNQTLVNSGITGSPNISTAATQISPVSSAPYLISISAGTLASANYSFTFVNGTLALEKAILTVTAGNASRPYGAANPGLTHSTAGFVNGEVLSTSGVTGTASLSTAAVASSNVGAYPIVVAAGTLTSENYAFAFVDGEMNITKAATITTITNAAALSAENAVVGAPYLVSWTTIPASGDSTAMTGSVVVSDGTGATCTTAVSTGGCNLVSTGAGPKAITASYAGDSNFSPSTSAATPLTTVVVISGTVRIHNLNGTPTVLPGVTVTLAGTLTGEQVTDTNGRYSFTSPIPNGNYTLTPQGFGLTYGPQDRAYADVTGNIADADFVAAAAPVPTPTPAVSPSPTPTPAATPSPIESPNPPPTPVSTPSPAPSATPISSPTPQPTPTPSTMMGGEGDVVHGDGSAGGGDGVNGDDLSAVRGFVVGSAPAETSSMQFQHGDTSPRDPAAGSYGDGVIDASDATVVRLYSLGMLPGTAAAGPIVPATAPTPAADPGSQRVIKAVSVATQPGETVTMQFLINSTGEEASASFTLDYDESVLGNPIVGLGNGVSAGSYLTTNMMMTGSGKIGVLVDSVENYEAGTRQVITVRFKVSPAAQIGLYPVRFENGPTPQSVSSDAGILLPAAYETGYIQIGATAASVSVGGRVTNSLGQGLRNAIVALTNPEGTRRTVTTGSFGHYRFDGVESGRTYVVSVGSKRFRFTPRTVVVTDNIIGLDLVAQE